MVCCFILNYDFDFFVNCVVNFNDVCGCGWGLDIVVGLDCDGVVG